MKILLFPHPNLFIKTEDVLTFDSSLASLLDQMWLTMEEARGIGLSANQVGLNIRAFVMKDKEGNRVDLINPKIRDRSIAPANLREGCLSAPQEFVLIPDRADWVRVIYQDKAGSFQVGVFHGIYSVAVQHEIQHLEGESFMQSRSLSKSHKKKLAAKWGI